MKALKLFSFSLPAVAASFIEPLAGVIDNALVGQRDTKDLAALALATSILSSSFWIFNYFIHGSSAKVSSALSEKNEIALKRWIRLVLIASLICGALMAGILYLVSSPLFIFMEVKPGIELRTESYFYARLWGIPFTLAASSLLGVLRGFKLMKATLYILAFVTLINASLNYFFLFPLNLDLYSVAWSTNFSFLLGAILSLCLIAKQLGSWDFLFDKKFQAQLSDLNSFGRETWFFFLRTFSIVMSFFFSTKIASHLGTIQLAAHQILIQVWMICSFFIDGLAIAGNVLVSEAISLKSSKKYRDLLKNLYFLGGLFGLVLSGLLFIFKESILLVFSSDEAVIATGLTFFTIQIWGQISNSLAYTLDGVIFGLQKYQYLAYMMLSGSVFIIIPFYYYAYTHLSLAGIWWGLVALNIWRVIWASRLCINEGRLLAKGEL